MQTATNTIYFLADAATQKRLQDLNTPWKLRLYLWKVLPAAAFVGIGLKYCDGLRAQVSLPYGWRSQNPFQSIYFAAQCAAAEFSTGILALVALANKPKVSMLVSKVEMEFVKKATSLTIFTCEQGAEVNEAIQKAIDTREGQTIVMHSVGRQSNGEIVSQARFTWSFKAK